MAQRGKLRDLLILAAALALLVAAIPASGSAAKKKAKHKKAATSAVFCGSAVVDNYWAPLEKLKPIPAVPEGGVLPFAPAGLTLGVTGPQGILVGGSTSIGLRLTNAAATTPRLGWVVLERLIRFSADGTSIRPAGLKRIDLKQLPAGKHRGLTFPLTSTPGIYSLEITIQNHRGRLLGRYGEYVRVVERTVNVGITLAAYDNLVPGAYLESCFENHGSAAVTPTGTSLERFDGRAWRPVTVPVGPQYAPAQTPILRSLGPGEAERIGTLIPPDAKPGLYKLTATATVLDSGEPVVLTAEFGVL
ncbi:MAG TPA: hypothetical protein VJL81_10445 [Solirubrobacterales bacterium]|nr:hypothetical protein [Solirubrobacterales bacterium]